MSDEVLHRLEGRAGRITLNRPKALNALTLGMVQSISAALSEWRGDGNVEVVILDGAGERGLCAGGDVRSLYDSAKDGVGFAAGYWREEYRLNSLIHHYRKPFVAIMDGLVMGGGIGLSAHARHRIVTEKSQLAMPETTIGLIPDVGGTWILSRLAQGLGAYIALTGYRMNGSDAIQAGFAGTFLPSGRIAGFIDGLARPSEQSVEDIIDEAEAPIPMSPLMANAVKIERWFAFDSVEEIVNALSSTVDPLAVTIKADLAQRSPLALKLTLEAIRRAREYRTLEQALTMEYRLCTALFRHGEFIEGVRALLIDKDKAPMWRPGRLSDIDDTMIKGFFAPPLAIDAFELEPQI